MTKYVKQILRQRLGLEPTDSSRDKELEIMSNREIFDECLRWEGIIGYGDRIISMVEDIFGVTLE